ncbi:MAG: Trk system potassium transporter TrkA [Clostridia bacterium]|nr:Trk system potassium transporter TrkA [Clostridia bacterium]
MKILIAGDGRVGSTLARQLSAEGHDLVLIDSNGSVLENTEEKYDLMSVQGNCASMQTLLQADVEHAELLIACTGTDEVNLLSCLTAHRLNPKIHTIARIRDPEYLEQAYKMRDAFGLSLTFNPERQAAREIERLLKSPGFLKRDYFAHGRVEIAELRVEEESRLCNVPLTAISGIVKCRVLVCSVLRDGQAIAPDGRFVIRAGDRLFVTASSDNLAIMLKNLGVVTHKVRNVLLAGGGMVAYYLAQQLENSSITVHILERDPERCRKLAALVPHAQIVQGDVGDQSFLDSEGLANYDALVSLTGSDELNMIVSLYADSKEIPQIITRLGHVENNLIIDSLPLGSVICPRKLCCNNIVRYVRAMQNQSGAALTIHSIADGHAEAMEFAVDEDTLHCGEPLRQIKLKPHILLVGISRGHEVEIPDGNSTFSRGDHVVIVSSGEDVILQLNDIFA